MKADIFTFCHTAKFDAEREVLELEGIRHHFAVNALPGVLGQVALVARIRFEEGIDLPGKCLVRVAIFDPAGKEIPGTLAQEKDVQFSGKQGANWAYCIWRFTNLRFPVAGFYRLRLTVADVHIDTQIVPVYFSPQNN